MKNRNKLKQAIGAVLFASAVVSVASLPFAGDLHAQGRSDYNGNWQEGRHKPNWDERNRYKSYYRQPDIYYSAPPVYYPPPVYYAPRGPSLNLTFPLFR